MPDEPNKTPAEGTPPPAENKPAPTDNMLKVLGYYTDPQKQEEVPAPDAGDTPPPEEPAAEAPPAEGEPAAPAEGEPEGEAKPAVVPDPNRARKVKPAEAAPAPTLTKEEITEAMREAIKPKEAATPDPLAKYGELLLPEKRALELAQFAARAMPERYKDMEAKEVAWIAKNREKVNEIVERDGNFDPTTEEYVEFSRKNRPSYQAGDREELFILRAAAKGKEEARIEFQQQLAERDRRINEMEVRPKIQKVKVVIEDDILSVLEKPVAEAIKADPKKAVETHGIEAPLAIAIITDTQHNAQEYLALANGVRDYNKNDPVHVNLVQFIRTQGAFLEKIPEAQRTREGKVLVSRERWAEIPKDQRSKFVTFSDGDIIDMIAVGGRQYLQSAVKAEYTRLEKAGFKRNGAPTPPPPAKETAPDGSNKAAATPPPAKPAPKAATPPPPKGGSTPAPGATGGNKAPAKEAKNPVLVSLGYDKV